MSLKLFDLTSKRVFVAGHRGMVGSAVLRRLASCKCEVIVAERRQVDLVRQDDTERFIAATKPDVVVVAAAKVGEFMPTAHILLNSSTRTWPLRSM